jgi:hypothetical protein
LDYHFKKPAEYDAMTLLPSNRRPAENIGIPILKPLHLQNMM